MTHAAIPHRLSRKTRGEQYRPAANDFAPVPDLLRWARSRVEAAAFDDGAGWQESGRTRETGERRVFKSLRPSWHAGFDVAEKAAREHAARVATDSTQPRPEESPPEASRSPSAIAGS